MLARSLTQLFTCEVGGFFRHPGCIFCRTRPQLLAPSLWLDLPPPPSLWQAGGFHLHGPTYQSGFPGVIAWVSHLRNPCRCPRPPATVSSDGFMICSFTLSAGPTLNPLSLHIRGKRSFSVRMSHCSRHIVGWKNHTFVLELPLHGFQKVTCQSVRSVGAFLPSSSVHPSVCRPIVHFLLITGAL